MHKRFHAFFAFMLAPVLLAGFPLSAPAEPSGPTANGTSWDMAAEKALPVQKGVEPADAAQTTNTDGNSKRESDLLQRLENTKNSAKDLME